MKPDYAITIDGNPATLHGRLIRLTVRDLRGFEADQLELALDDSDGHLAIPPAGAVIALKLGWKGEQLAEMGTYTVDEVDHTGTPDVLTIRARSADFSSALTEKRTIGWDAETTSTATLGDLVNAIAKRHGLTAAIRDVLAARPIKHIDQTNESDANFLTRLAVKHDAIATIKNGNLLFVRAGDGRNASGAAIKPITITRGDGDHHAYTRGSRKTSHTGARATWYDRSAFTAHDITIGDATKLKTLTQLYTTEDEARAATEAEWRRISRAGGALQLDLAIGRPGLAAETPVTVTGWKEDIDQVNWIATQVTHQVDNGGFVTKVELEPATKV